MLQYYCKKKESIFDCYSAMQISGACINVQRDVGNLSEPLLAESELPLQKYKLNSGADLDILFRGVDL